MRRGHAFTDLVHLATNADPTTSGGIGVQLVVTTTLDTLQSRPGQLGVRCVTTETGHPLSAGTTRRLACDTTVIPMVLGAASEPLDVARATRTIPTRIRRALNARDGGCAFPGCTRPHRWADAHHIRHWADGGPTTVTNLVLLCGHHHDLIHHNPMGRPSRGGSTRVHRTPTRHRTTTTTTGQWTTTTPGTGMSGGPRGRRDRAGRLRVRGALRRPAGHHDDQDHWWIGGVMELDIADACDFLTPTVADRLPLVAR